MSQFHLSIGTSVMLNKLSILLKNFFPEDKNYKLLNEKFFTRIIKISYDRIEYCLQKINNKYYRNNKKIFFNHLNSDHMCTFLYFLYNSGYREKIDKKIITKLFYLNKILHSVDIFYHVNLPDIFLLVHPLGTVIGRAKFDNYLTVYNNVGVGAEAAGRKLIYPNFGSGVILYSGSSVIGDCKVGNNVIFGSNSKIINKNIKDNKVVLGDFAKNRIKNNKINNIKINFY